MYVVCIQQCNLSCRVLQLSIYSIIYCSTSEDAWASCLVHAKLWLLYTQSLLNSQLHIAFFSLWLWVWQLPGGVPTWRHFCWTEDSHTRWLCGAEGTEDFFASLSIPASSVYLGVSAGPVDSVTVSILDDDNVTVEFSMSEYEVSESAGEVTLPEQLTTPCWCTSAMEQLKVSAIRTYVVYMHSMHAWSNVLWQVTFFA